MQATGTRSSPDLRVLLQAGIPVKPSVEAQQYPVDGFVPTCLSLVPISPLRHATDTTLTIPPVSTDQYTSCARFVQKKVRDLTLFHGGVLRMRNPVDSGFSAATQVLWLPRQ